MDAMTSQSTGSAMNAYRSVGVYGGVEDADGQRLIQLLLPVYGLLR